MQEAGLTVVREGDHGQVTALPTRTLLHRYCGVWLCAHGILPGCRYNHKQAGPSGGRCECDAFGGTLFALRE